MNITFFSCKIIQNTQENRLFSSISAILWSEQILLLIRLLKKSMHQMNINLLRVEISHFLH